MKLVDVLKLFEQEKASDIILKTNSKIFLRVFGEIKAAADDKYVTKEDIEEFCQILLSKEYLKEILQEEKSVDTFYEDSNLGRFRIHIFYQKNLPTLVLRKIPSKIPTLDELGAPPVMKELCKRPKGLIIVNGPAGSGKTTTQAAMVDYINSNFEKHIVCIEDPVEYVHTNKKGLVSQRCLGEDTLSFNEALRRVFRQDPDVILLGEMRDYETITFALTAAETGHLVITTLHTRDSVSSLERIIDIFPQEVQGQVRHQLMINLVGIISQILVKRTDKKGLIVAWEILVNIPAVKNLIREGKLILIKNVLETGKRWGMMRLEQSLSELFKQKIIDYEEGEKHALDKEFYKSLTKE